MSAVRDWVIFPNACLVSFNIISVPQTSNATSVARGTPAPSDRLPFDSAMRHKNGSRVGLSHPATSCEVEQNIDRCPVTLNFNGHVVEHILKLYLELLITEALVLAAETSTSNANWEWSDAFRVPTARRMRPCSNARNKLDCGKSVSRYRCRVLDLPLHLPGKVSGDDVRQGGAEGAPSCCTCCLAMLAKPRF